MMEVDLMSRIPIYEQLYRGVIVALLQGELQEGAQLPSVRGLAMELHVNPNTVAKAYALLERDGFVRSVAGRGSFVVKPDLEKAQGVLLGEFDSIVRQTLEMGISGETLWKRLTELLKESENE
ncbi:MAG: GntR family transcriptional regulator [Oscillospiraceae bacterium]